jgi:23S rRNA (pseudouridine1915-N3)-methyltransferase
LEKHKKSCGLFIAFPQKCDKFSLNVNKSRFHLSFIPKKFIINCMKIKIIATGKLKEDYLKAGIAEYTKRLTSKLDIIEIPDEKIPERPSQKQIETVKNTEGEKILAKLAPEDEVIALAIKGQLLTSEELAQTIKDAETYGTPNVVFLIGGSLGLSDDVLARANTHLSFGRLTLPHQLMRLVLIEQIYRSQMINRGSTYHK